jgi:hypothetical protein
VDDLWSVPINLQVTKLVRFGTQPVSVGVGLRYWAATTPNGPQGFGFRVIVSPLWPTGRR